MTRAGTWEGTASSGTGSSSLQRRSCPWTRKPRPLVRPKRVLVAGIGNVFLGDDGFGVEVVRRLAGRELPKDVEVADFGIRGMDLIYALQEDYEVVIFVDAAPRGGARQGDQIRPHARRQASSHPGGGLRAQGDNRRRRLRRHADGAERARAGGSGRSREAGGVAGRADR